MEEGKSQFFFIFFDSYFYTSHEENMRGNICVSKRVNMEAFQLQTKTDKWADNGTAGKITTDQENLRMWS